MKISKPLLIVLILIVSIKIFPENILLNNKLIYINKVNGWTSLNEYLNTYKRFKNYKISNDKEKQDLILTVKIKKIVFIIIDFKNNTEGGMVVEGGGVVAQKKNEQTVKFTYEIELKIQNVKNSSVKKINFTDSFNIWFSSKKIQSNEIDGFENELFILKNEDKDDEEDINISFNKYNMTLYKEQILMDISKKTANRLITEL